MRITLMILSMVLLFLGYEAFNIGGLISSFFIYGGYIFLLLHVVIILGLYKKNWIAEKAFLGENIFFILLTIYYIITIPKLNLGTSSVSEMEPNNIDYIRALKYGILPLILFILNIVVALKSIKGTK
jgi:hypothetical protein